MDISPINNFINKGKDPSMVEKKINNLDIEKNDKELLEVCKEFEGIFLNMMLKEMKKTVPENGLIEKSQGSMIFEDMYIEELSNDIARGSNGMGLAQEMYKQLKRNNIQI